MKGILISWGTPIAGREQHAIEEFASYMQWANGLKAQGKIARFDIYAPQFGTYEKLAGFTVIEGSEKQVDEILESDEFRARTQRVFSVAKGLRVEALDVGDAVVERMKVYGATLRQMKL